MRPSRLWTPLLVGHSLSGDPSPIRRFAMDDLLIALACMAPLAAYLLYTKGRGARKAQFACVGLGLAFGFFAVGHFVVTPDLVNMLPPWIPQRPLLIYATGGLEALIAFGLFTEKWRKAAGIAAAVVLVLFFPANVYAALHHTGVGAHRLGPQYLWVRTLLQLFLLAWALWPVFRPDVRSTAWR